MSAPAATSITPEQVGFYGFIVLVCVIATVLVYVIRRGDK